MRNLPKILFGLVIVVALAYGAIKGVLYMRTHDAMEQLITESLPYADISYRGISTEVTGAVAVEGLQIRPRESLQTLRIKQARISTDDPIGLAINGLPSKQGDPIPEQLGFQFTGIEVPLDDEWVAQLREQSHREAVMRGVSSDPCLNGAVMDAGLLKAMGFSSISSDISMDYRFDQSQGLLNIGMAFEVNEIQRGEMSVQLGGLESLQTGQLTAMPHFVEADLLASISRAFGDRYIQHCARLNNKTVEQHRALLTQTMLQDLERSGVTLGIGLSQALTTFYRDWGALSIRMKPRPALGMLEIMAIDQHDITERLGLTLRVNDQLVTDTTFSFDLQQLAKLQASEDAEGQVFEEQPKERWVRRYVPVSAEELPQHIGSAVRIKPRYSPVRKGKLTAIRRGEAVLEQLTHGGSFTSYVMLDNVELIEAEVIEKRETK